MQFYAASFSIMNAEALLISSVVRSGILLCRTISHCHCPHSGR